MIDKLIKIRELIEEYADECSYQPCSGYQSESISGGGGWYDTIETDLEPKDAQEALKILDELISQREKKLKRITK